MNITILAYPPNCTHVLQSLDVVCFAQLKRLLADEIEAFQDLHARGVDKGDFAEVFGMAYLKAFTGETIKEAFKSTGVFPYNPNAITAAQTAPSEATSTRIVSYGALHSTPVRKTMSALSSYHATTLDEDETDLGAPMALDDPFIDDFTPTKRMRIFHRSLASSSSCSYLISKEPVTSETRIIQPVFERPPIVPEPDWSLIQRGAVEGWSSKERMASKIDELTRSLKAARNQIKAREAVIEGANATIVVLDLTSQRFRAALAVKEKESAKEKNKAKIFVGGKGRVVTDAVFVEELEKAQKLKDVAAAEKEARSRARVQVAAEKEIGEARWKLALENWEKDKLLHENECKKMRSDGVLVKNLPKKPKRPLKKAVLAETMVEDEMESESEGDSEGDESLV